MSVVCILCVLIPFITYRWAPSPPVDIIWAVMIVWRIRGKSIRTVLCCVVYNSCAQWYAHIYEQFLKMSFGLGLGLVFVHLFWFSSLCVFFWLGIDYVVLLFAFAVLGLVSSVLQQEILCWVGRKTLTQSTYRWDTIRCCLLLSVMFEFIMSQALKCYNSLQVSAYHMRDIIVLNGMRHQTMFILSEDKEKTMKF